MKNPREYRLRRVIARSESRKNSRKNRKRASRSEFTVLRTANSARLVYRFLCAPSSSLAPIRSSLRVCVILTNSNYFFFHLRQLAISEPRNFRLNPSRYLLKQQISLRVYIVARDSYVSPTDLEEIVTV